MLPSDVELASKLLAPCQRAFPSRSDLTVSSATSISNGWECEVYSFALEGEEAGEHRREELILRVYPGNDGVQKSTREFDVMRRLHLAGFAVPRMLALEAEGSTLGRPFVIMEKIDGPLMGPTMLRAAAEERRRLLTLFCRLFVDLHAFDWRPFVSDASRYEPEGYTDRWLAWGEEMLRRFGRLEFVPLLDWLKARGEEVSCRRLSVTHGDYHPWNILMRADSAAFIIDWTQADISDYRMDLAWTLLLMRGIIGREVRDDILHEYERLSGAPAEQIEFFEVAASLKRLFGIVVSLTEGPEKLGMRPGAEALMKQHLAHLATPHAVVREQTGLTIPAVEELLAKLG